MRVIEVAHARR